VSRQRSDPGQITTWIAVEATLFRKERRLSLQTIIINTGSGVFDGASPIGLKYEVSASRFVKRLRERVRERFPKTQVFVRWSPKSTRTAEISTVPKTPEAESKLRDLAENVREAQEDWLRYDQDVIASFHSW
jgi:hypothetical protein